VAGDELISGAAALDPWTDQLWRATLKRRVLGVAALGIAAVAVPAIGPHRAWIGIGVLVTGLVYNAGLHAVYTRTGRIPTVMIFVDVGICFVIPLLAENSFVPTLLVLLTVVALAAATVGQRHALLGAAVATVGMTAVALVVRPEGALVGVIAYAITSVMVIGNVGAVAASERRLRARYGSLVERLDAIIWESEPDTAAFTYISPQVEHILGHPAEALFADGFWRAQIHPEDRDRVVRAHLAATAEGRDHELEYRTIAADGRVVHLHDRVSVTTDAQGQPLRMQGVMVDITERRRAEVRVRQYADIVESVQTGLVVLHLDDPDDDRSLRLLAANPAACVATNRALDEWTDRYLHEALPAVIEAGLLPRLASVVRDGSSFAVDRLVMRHGQPNEAVLSLRAFPLPGDAVGVALEDITAASLAVDALFHQARHDGLTGLPNRSMLKERLGAALTAAHRTGEAVALLVMDLDQFKEVNDALGHHVGDHLLIALAQRLRRELSEADVIARLGGDEFAVLLTTRASEAAAVAVAERMRSSLLEPFESDEMRIQTNASIGIAIYPDHATDADALTQRADVAMYQAKRTGTGYAVYRADHDRSSVRRITLLSEFRRALDRAEFVIHYQPVVAVNSRATVQVEALIRWQHPEHGLLGPEEFIELAEVSGFIQPLTRWVLDQAIAVAAGWWADGHRVGLAVNLSVRNLYDPGLPGHLAALLATHGLPASELTLEVTESELMVDPTLALEVLGAVGRLGISTAVDDFGTGYSSLTYLKDLPVREIKIDRSFIAGMVDSADARIIVRSMIDLGHNLNLVVVAEGVEGEAALAELDRLGCDLAQGFHVSQPLTAEAFRTWHRSRAQRIGDVSGAPARR
jgi:diguanylate cyclase (GGDEF)-like protein/PAS domain S-box-containing protein